MATPFLATFLVSAVAGDLITGSDFDNLPIWNAKSSKSNSPPAKCAVLRDSTEDYCSSDCIRLRGEGGDDDCPQMSINASFATTRYWDIYIRYYQGLTSPDPNEPIVLTSHCDGYSVQEDVYECSAVNECDTSGNDISHVYLRTVPITNTHCNDNSAMWLSWQTDRNHEDDYTSFGHLRIYGKLITPAPTPVPTRNPTRRPTTKSPTRRPTTRTPTRIPTRRPTPVPIISPSRSPTLGPTSSPTFEPTLEPTLSPTDCIDIEGTYSNDGTITVDIEYNETNSWTPVNISDYYLSMNINYVENPGFRSFVNCSHDEWVCYVKCYEDGDYACEKSTIEMDGNATNVTDFVLECTGTSITRFLCPSFNPIQ